MHLTSFPAQRVRINCFNRLFGLLFYDTSIFLSERVTPCQWEHLAPQKDMEESRCEPEPLISDDDLALVERSLSGDQSAFESLVKKHKLRIYRVAFSILKIAEDAEDVMQKVLIKLSLHLGTFKRDAQFTTWLTRIALNESLAQRRARKPTVSLEALQEMPFAGDSEGPGTWYDSPERALRKKELKRLIERTYCALPKKFREVFVMREIEGRDAEETATILNVTVPAVKSRLFRARRLMHKPQGSASEAFDVIARGAQNYSGPIDATNMLTSRSGNGNCPDQRWGKSTCSSGVFLDLGAIEPLQHRTS